MSPTITTAKQKDVCYVSFEGWNNSHQDNNATNMNKENKNLDETSHCCKNDWILVFPSNCSSSTNNNRNSSHHHCGQKRPLSSNGNECFLQPRKSRKGGGAIMDRDVWYSSPTSSTFFSCHNDDDDADADADGMMRPNKNQDCLLFTAPTREECVVRNRDHPRRRIGTSSSCSFSNPPSQKMKLLPRRRTRRTNPSQDDLFPCLWSESIRTTTLHFRDEESRYGGVCNSHHDPHPAETESRLFLPRLE